MPCWLALRSATAGVRARHSLVCLHLAHERPWRDPALVARNKQWNRELERRRTSDSMHLGGMTG